MATNDKQKSIDLINELIEQNTPDLVYSSVDRDMLMSELIDVIKRYVVISDSAALAVALWVIQTWAYEAFTRCPLLLINAPDRECGKTQLLKVVGMLVRRPLETANITLASLFRLISKYHPTLLIDEADTFMAGKSELAGVVNKGYEKVGGVVLRVEPRGTELVECAYQVYGPKAMAGIKLERHLPGPTISRGIQIRLERKEKADKIERLRLADPRVFKSLYSRVNRFVEEYRETLANGWDDMPEQLSDREQDNWESLLAIAHCLGPDWYNKARGAAVEICARTAPPKSSGHQLLEDIREILSDWKEVSITSAELLEQLCTSRDMDWDRYNFGQPLTHRQLTRELSSYGIKTQTIRKGQRTPKGYYVRQFDKVFKLYLSEKAEDFEVVDTTPPDVEAPKLQGPPSI